MRRGDVGVKDMQQELEEGIGNVVDVVVDNNVENGWLYPLYL